MSDDQDQAQQDRQQQVNDALRVVAKGGKVTVTAPAEDQQMNDALRALAKRRE